MHYTQKKSNYLNLENSIWTAIAQRQKDVRILPYIKETEEEIFSMVQSLEVQYAIFENNEEAEQLKKDLREKLRDVEKLKNNVLF